MNAADLQSSESPFRFPAKKWGALAGAGLAASIPATLFAKPAVVAGEILEIPDDSSFIYALEWADRLAPWVLGGAIIAGAVLLYRQRAAMQRLLGQVTPSVVSGIAQWMAWLVANKDNDKPVSDLIDEDSSPLPPKPPSSPDESQITISPEQGATTLPPSDCISDILGFKIPNYTVIRKLGAGSMGEVFLSVEDGIEGNPVAIKILPKIGTEYRETINRFKREAKSMSKIDHPNVIRFFHYGVVPGGIPFIVMEYITGGTLNDWMERKHPSAVKTKGLEAEAAAILIQCLNGLEEIHQSGIVHRDLSPANIFMQGGVTPKIADFGLAKTIQPGTTITDKGTIVGTLSYMAPEQVNGKTPANAKMDIHYLGVVLFKMLTGVTPYQTSSANSDSDVLGLLKRIRWSPVPDPRTINPDLSPQISFIVMKALEKNPELRYPNATKFLKDLELFLASLEQTANISRQTMDLPSG